MMRQRRGRGTGEWARVCGKSKQAAWQAWDRPGRDGGRSRLTQTAKHHDEDDEGDDEADGRGEDETGAGPLRWFAD